MVVWYWMSCMCSALLKHPTHSWSWRFLPVSWPAPFYFGKFWVSRAVPFWTALSHATVLRTNLIVVLHANPLDLAIHVPRWQSPCNEPCLHHSAVSKVLQSFFHYLANGNFWAVLGSLFEPMPDGLSKLIRENTKRGDITRFGGWIRFTCLIVIIVAGRSCWVSWDFRNNPC